MTELQRACRYARGDLRVTRKTVKRIAKKRTRAAGKRLLDETIVRINARVF